MKTVGTLLKETREVQFYTLEDVERHTKIRKELIEALERDDYAKLPPVTFIQGFIKNYGKFLGLDDTKLLAMFRRDFESRKHPPQVMKSFSEPLKMPRFRVTPSHVLWAVVGVVVVSFFTYLWFEYRQFVGAPELVVSGPVDQQSVEVPSVVVEGKTAPEVAVMINDQEVAVDKDGNFRAEVKLSSLVNKIVVRAVSRFGQTSEVERLVFVKQ